MMSENDRAGLLLALHAWQDARALGQNRAQACHAAALALSGDPWRILRCAGPLARAADTVAEGALSLDERLQPARGSGSRELLRISKGALYPDLLSFDRASGGVFDTPAEMAREVVQRALAATQGPARRGLDPACGIGTFLAALREGGVQEVEGWDLDPAALAVASVVAPQGELRRRDALLEADAGRGRFDVVVGNPPFVAPEVQDKDLRKVLGERLPWLHGRYDLAVPFAWQASEALRPGGGLCLVLPASLLVQPYGRELRRRWLSSHMITYISEKRRFQGAEVSVCLVALQAGAGPGPVGVWGVPATELLGFENAPLCSLHRPGDLSLVQKIRARSIPLGSIARIGAGLVAHGKGHGKASLIFDSPQQDTVPYVDARDLVMGRRRHLRYLPEKMHRAKHPELFSSPKLLVARITGGPGVQAWIDHEGLFAGHTLNVLHLDHERVSLARILELVKSPLQRALILLERGDRLDLYPKDLAAMPVPSSWLEGSVEDMEDAWRLDTRERERLLELTRSLRQESASVHV